MTDRTVTPRGTWPHDPVVRTPTGMRAWVKPGWHYDTAQARRGMYDNGGDTRAYSNRGRKSRGIVNQQPAPLAPSVSRRPTIPTPTVSQQQTTPSPSISERRTMPARMSVTANNPGSSSRQQPTPVTPSVSSSNQRGSARASQQPARTPSDTFGGYRGAGEAKTQSLRGQTSRQSIERVRPSAPRQSRRCSCRQGCSGDRQRR